MISIPPHILHKARKKHLLHISEVLSIKIAVWELCMYFWPTSRISKANNLLFDTMLTAIPGASSIKVATVNWFLLPNIRRSKKNNVTVSIQRKIASITKTQNFFEKNYRAFSDDPTTILALKQRLAYFDNALLQKLLAGNPSELLDQDRLYKSVFAKSLSSSAEKEVARLISFLFDYDEFSEKESMYDKGTGWSAYDLTELLKSRTCLYCNRNHVITVSHDGNRIIRPELDHFFAKSIYPILALSFYNLIPSCHICNSNLKGSTEFSLSDNLHPYISDFDTENVRFTYAPTNPAAFFAADNGLTIKLDVRYVKNYAAQIEGNIRLFKLNEIYNFHLDVVVSMQQLQRKTNKNKIREIYDKILVSRSGKKYFHSEQEVYELAIRNHYNPIDFHKKPIAKFEKDIAMEIGLIDKK